MMSRMLVLSPGQQPHGPCLATSLYASTLNSPTSKSEVNFELIDLCTGDIISDHMTIT